MVNYCATAVLSLNLLCKSSSDQTYSMLVSIELQICSNLLENVKGVRAQGRRASTTQLVVSVRGSWRGYAPSPFFAGRVMPSGRRLGKEEEGKMGLFLLTLTSLDYKA
jgi:hypothetical protein